MSTDRYTLRVGDLDAEVIVKPIRNLHIGIYPPDGRVRVAAPTRMTRDAVHGALSLRLAWIRRQIDAFERQPRESPREYRAGESHWHMGRRYRLRIMGDSSASAIVLTGPFLDVSVRGSPTADKVATAIERWRRSDLAIRAEPVVLTWADRIGVPAPAFGIKRMRTRWGTYSARSNRIWLNLALSRLPVSCLSYVILHEVAHCSVPNHGEAFLSLLDLHMPEWRSARSLLSDLPYVSSHT